ncbi:hypothetical protein HBI62_244690 [Parastagonospora nodorum]|nr:hypothetical protein HBI62_244690 [Parastagonospora nodorum]KAH6134273.1 hypothetical protein HBI63_244320 [Parastagonospora nodorum]KAH6158441.1 hypothetical protein HBI61_244230 [Parastagonospora nodorum]
MSQTNVREGYKITTLEVVELIEDLISYLAVAKCTRLRNAQIPKVFYEAAVRQYSAKVKIEDLSNTLTPTLSEIMQQRSSSVVSNRSTALITDKFSVASLTEPAILNDANVALVDAVHHSVVMDALTMTLIKDDDNLLGTVNSYIKSRRLRARRKTEAADSRHAKVSRGRTKKDKDSEDSDTSSDVLRLPERKRLGKEAQLKKTRDEEELAKLDGLLDSDDYRSDSSSDIDSKDDSEDEEATTAKDLAREQKERLKALLNAKTRDGLSARVGTAIEHCTLEEWTLAAVFFSLTDAYILYFKELLSNNSGIFANAIGMGKTRAIVLATEVQNARAEGNATEHNAVNDDDKLCPTKGERTFYCADLLALRFCFFSDSPLENISRLTKEEAMEMRIDTTNAISKALAAANKLVAPQSYIIPEANTPAVHPKATKHCLALSAARFVIVCGFRKIDKHVFRAYNTISVTAQAILLPGHVTVWGRTIFDEFYNCKLEGIIMAKKGVSNWFNATDKRDSVTSDRIYKMEDAVYRSIAETLSYRTSSYPALATLKAAQFKTYSSCKVKRFTSNSVKDLFTNLSKDYFLVREARAITKSSPKFQNLSNLCSESIAAEDAAKAANILLLPKEVRAKILIELYKLIVQAVTWLGLREKFGDESILVMQGEMCVGIVYFNPDSELELKVLSKQDVKTTS